MTQRALALGTVMALGFGRWACRVSGPTPPQPPAPAPKVVEADKLTDTLYVLKGGGGDTALLLTAARASSSIPSSPAGASRCSTRSRRSPTSQ